MSKKFFFQTILKKRKVGRIPNSKKSLSGGRWGGAHPPKSLSGGGGGFNLPFARGSLALFLKEFSNELVRMKIWGVSNQPIEKNKTKKYFFFVKEFHRNVTLKFGTKILNWRLVGGLFLAIRPTPRQLRMIISKNPSYPPPIKDFCQKISRSSFE